MNILFGIHGSHGSIQVSGVEQTTAASFEARHSYTLDDLFWDRTTGAGHDFPMPFLKRF